MAYYWNSKYLVLMMPRHWGHMFKSVHPQQPSGLQPVLFLSSAEIRQEENVQRGLEVGGVDLHPGDRTSAPHLWTYKHCTFLTTFKSHLLPLVLCVSGIGTTSPSLFTILLFYCTAFWFVCALYFIFCLILLGFPACPERHRASPLTSWT